MHAKLVLHALVVLCAAVLIEPVVAQGVPDADPVLVENSTVKIRRSDYERELERLPADLRPGFATNERRVNDLLRRMLLESTLAAQARAEKLPERPEYAARIAAEVDKLIAQLKIADVEKAAGEAFEARRASFEVRARELYTVDKPKYSTPEQVSASHILFETKSRSSDDALKLARDARQQLADGADFARLAREVSEDRSAKANFGNVGWFARGEMDPAFSEAAFAMRDIGEIAGPVKSSFGWHLIRLEGRRPAQQKSFEDVREAIVADLKTKYVNDQRDAFVARMRNDPTIRANREAIDALLIRVDAEAIRRKVGESTPGAMAPK